AIASDMNPWFAWVGAMAEQVKAARQPVADDSPFKQAERTGSEWISASLDFYRDVRDATSEAQFFQTFGVLFPALHPERSQKAKGTAAPKVTPAAREQPVVRE